MLDSLMGRGHMKGSPWFSRLGLGMRLTTSPWKQRMLQNLTMDAECIISGNDYGRVINAMRCILLLGICSVIHDRSN
jgi:hypothetical protein